MSTALKKNRLRLIEEIEDTRKSRLIVCILGDRRNAETKIASDILTPLSKHLTKMGKQNRIDLMLYSTGGITMAGFALVNLIREFTDEFRIIIPSKALSCATLIALGADSIFMTRLGLLSPIDPSVGTPFAPILQVPGAPKGNTRQVPISVEDVMGFLGLAEKSFDLKSEKSRLEVFKELTNKVHPIALGSVYRSRQQISFFGESLLSMHMDDENQIEKTVKILTEERFSHNYLMGRREAIETLELNIEEADLATEQLVMNLFNLYVQALLLNQPYHPESELNEGDSVVAELNRAIIETTGLTHVFRTRKEINRVEIKPPAIPQPTIGYQERVLEEGWFQNEKI
ncbi:MAG: hypothetical protein KGY80_04515 [Candidatus Thorarchaeota archaeon]|nr:hypothetical protein [Candidatus Thorarchaeota archaeon]